MDSNAPQVKQDPNIITNTTHIDTTMPTIKYALKDGANSVALRSHLGQPNGEKIKMFYIAPAAKVVREKLCRHVQLTKGLSIPKSRQLVPTQLQVVSASWRTPTPMLKRRAQAGMPMAQDQG